MEENKEQIEALTLEIENKNNLNKTLIAENEDMKVDTANKASTLARCAEAVHKTKDQMRTLKEKDEKLRQVENDKKTLENNITDLGDWINN